MPRRSGCDPLTPGAFVTRDIENLASTGTSDADASHISIGYGAPSGACNTPAAAGKLENPSAMQVKSRAVRTAIF
jgi:hypothetical protein